MCISSFCIRYALQWNNSTYTKICKPFSRYYFTLMLKPIDIFLCRFGIIVIYGRRKEVLLLLWRNLQLFIKCSYIFVLKMWSRTSPWLQMILGPMKIHWWVSFTSELYLASWFSSLAYCPSLIYSPLLLVQEIESRIIKALKPDLNLNPDPLRDRHCGELLAKKVVIVINIKLQEVMNLDET